MGEDNFFLIFVKLFGSSLLIFMFFYIKFRFKPYYIPQQEAPMLKKDHDRGATFAHHNSFMNYLLNIFLLEIKQKYTSVLAAQLFRHQLMCPGLPLAIRNPAP